MPTDVELWKEFEQYMRNQDEKDNVSVGQRDKGGNLLILGGHKANLWRLKSGLYSTGGETTPFGEEAVELYNGFNNTTLRSDYIRAVFNPWYANQFRVIAQIPSDSKPGVIYDIVRTPEGELLCDPKCEGFRFRHDCKHVQYVRQIEQEAK